MNATIAGVDSAWNVPSLTSLDSSLPHTFITPSKKINEGHNVSDFLVSKAHGDIMSFLLQLNRSMFPSNVQVSDQSKKSVQIWELGSPSVVFSDTVRNLGHLLEDLNRIIDDIPPDPGPRRFGNTSFKEWYRKVEDRTTDLLNSHLPPSVLSFPSTSEVTSQAELSSYFLGSFGSSQRLDYGSGHELSFLAFLGCIWKLGGFEASPEELRGIVLGLIHPYLTLIRRLILTYTLEPAGSHGVWGLDDHSFLPYIFGSAQYGPAISPKSLTPTEGSLPNAPDPADVAKLVAVERERGRNMYFSAIGFIQDVKKGPFWEHSPMLYDISGVRGGWGKINKGMIKMYNAEVLSKFPVVQHFPLGSLFSFEQDPDAKPPPASRGPPPMEGTKAPWANQVPNLSAAGAGTAALWASKSAAVPRDGISTAAPWASRPAGGEGFGMPTRLPESGRASALHARTLIPSATPAGASRERSMPPPTRAPWTEPR